MTFKEAAEAVLQAAGEPLSYHAITRHALERGLIATEGQTPEASINAQLSVDISRKGSESAFMRTAPGVYGLRCWLGREGIAEYVSEEDNDDTRLRVPFFPIYSKTAALLRVLNGTQKADFTTLNSEVYEQRGTPQEQVDWSDPDTWIPERLTGRSAELAHLIWEGTARTLNPRHLSGHWFLAGRYELIETDDFGTIRLTAKGENFISDPEGPTTQEVDVQEGLDRVLGLVAELGPAGRSELLPPFAAFAREVSKLRADSTIKSFLWARLRNLAERKLVERVGRSYSATERGLAWLARLGDENRVEAKQENDLLQLINDRREKVREEIAERLSKMDPFAFEHLVKNLLVEMEYEDVEVTSKSGDGGVDVTARIQLGITEVIEVVQVKRHAKKIQRQVLDALRGSLHRFRAVRGTIITTGGFARGTVEAAFEPGAPPITLIDGPKLIDMMLEYGIGVQKRRVELLEVDPSAFKGPKDGPYES